jgi:hypothetical protein
MFVKEMIYGTVIVIVSVVSGDSMRDFWLSEKNDWLSWWMYSANLERLDRRAIEFVDQILSRIDNIRKKIMIPPEGLISNIINARQNLVNELNRSTVQAFQIGRVHSSA